MNLLIHKTEKGMGNEDWYYLAADDAGRAYVLHEWSHRNGDGSYTSNEAPITIHEFLKNGGTRQDKLLELISKLVQVDE